MGADYGEPMKHDPDFRGPMKSRSCTDCICLVVFFAFLLGWGFVGFYAFANGDVRRLLAPTDSEGRKCGLDSTVQHLPYLVFFDISKCLAPDVPITGCPTPQVCVERCPNETIIVNNEVLSQAATNPTFFRELLDKIPCQRTVDKGAIQNVGQLAPLILEHGQCASYILKSESVSGRCLPNFLDSETNGIITAIIDNPSASVSQLEQNLNLLLSFNQVGTRVIEDLVASRWYMLATLLIALVVCMLYIALLRWFAAPLVWFSLLGVIGLLSYSIYLTSEQYVYYRDNPTQLTPSATNVNGVAQSILTMKETWLVLLILACVLLAIIVLTVLFLRKRIVIAIALIKEGSKAVSSIKSTYAFPIFPWLLQCGLVVLAVVIGLYLSSVGQTNFRVVGIESDTDCLCSQPFQSHVDCEPTEFNSICKSNSSVSSNLPSTICKEATCHFVGVTNPSVVPWFHAVNVVGFFWLIFFVQGLSEMMLAATFATWYWSFKKSNMPFFTLTAGVWRSIRYHMGTVAFGALIITICRLIRLVLEYIDHKVKKYDNVVTRALLCCLKCFFKCLESFLRFINKNAYIMCAVHGKNFFSSAKDAFNLLMRNILRVFVLDKVTDFLFFLSKLLVAIGMGLGAYFVLTTRELYRYTGQQELHYNLVPVVIITVATYLIACVFFDVYSMAVDTLFLCFLEDCERNDGSPEKPYFMSKNLMKILGKKNKFE